MFKIEMLPARQGDCLWIEYGSPQDPHVVLIDGGMKETAAKVRDKIGSLKERTGRARIELLVVTHIDNDHIGGINALLEDSTLKIEFGDVWFNGRPQLEDQFADILGVADGDKLSSLLKRGKLPWNKSFGGGLVQIADGAQPKEVQLAGGLSLSVIGPPPKRLQKLARDWLKVKDGDEGKQEDDHNGDILGRSDQWPARLSGDAKEDTAAANGSSIVIVASYQGKRALLCGDAFPSDVASGLEAYRAANGGGTSPIYFAAVKLSHHGSARNMSREMFELLDSDRYLISTDGTTFSHPDTQALLRAITWSQRKAQLHFNYANERTLWWINRKADLAPEFRRYDAFGPSPGSSGIAVAL